MVGRAWRVRQGEKGKILGPTRTYQLAHSEDEAPSLILTSPPGDSGAWNIWKPLVLAFSGVKWTEKTSGVKAKLLTQISKVLPRVRDEGGDRREVGDGGGHQEKTESE